MNKIITDFGSKKTFRSQLHILSTRLSKNDRFHVDNMLIYYSSLFRTIVNVELDASKYSDKTHQSKRFLIKRIKTHNCVTCKKLLEIVNLKSDYIQKIKIIKEKY